MQAVNIVRKERKLKEERKEYSLLCRKYVESGTTKMTRKEMNRFYYLKKQGLY